MCVVYSFIFYNHLTINLDPNFFFSFSFNIEIFDIMTEGQQFEFLGFTLNPAIRMAIMRKVCILETSFCFLLLKCIVTYYGQFD